MFDEKSFIPYTNKPAKYAAYLLRISSFILFNFFFPCLLQMQNILAIQQPKVESTFSSEKKKKLCKREVQGAVAREFNPAWNYRFHAAVDILPFLWLSSRKHSSLCDTLKSEQGENLMDV